MARSKRIAVKEAWEAHRKQDELLKQIERLRQANKLLADKFNQMTEQRDRWMEKAAKLQLMLEDLKNRAWWQRIFS